MTLSGWKLSDSYDRCDKKPHSSSLRKGVRMILDDNCTVVIRYWHNGKIGQRIAVYQNLDAAIKKKEFIIAQLQKAGAEYFIEYLPRFGEPIVFGTIYGLNQHGGQIK